MLLKSILNILCRFLNEYPKSVLSSIGKTTKDNTHISPRCIFRYNNINRFNPDEIDCIKVHTNVNIQ